MDATVGALVLGALSAGGAGLARAEIARLMNDAVRRLSRRGRLGRELAVVADALARSDEELAAEMERLGPEEKASAAKQLDEALTYDGPDHAERQATDKLAREAADLREVLVTSLQAMKFNKGQVVQASGQAVVHAPFHVGRDYNAGRPPVREQ